MRWRRLDDSSEEARGVKISISAVLFLIFLVVYASIPSSQAHAVSHKHPPKPEAPLDPDYVFALGAADRFMHAWQTGDIEHGIVQLSDGLRRSQDSHKVEQFFLNAKDRSYEISRGHGQTGRYSFPVVLVGTEGSQISRKPSELVVLETGKNDWVIDKLP
jgi:hypothetical protein